VNARGTTSWILLRQMMNQGLQIPIYGRTTHRSNRFPALEGTATSAVPAKQSLRFGNDNGAANRGYRWGQPSQDNAIRLVQLDLAVTFALKDCGLMPRATISPVSHRRDLNNERNTKSMGGGSYSLPPHYRCFIARSSRIGFSKGIQIDLDPGASRRTQHGFGQAFDLRIVNPCRRVPPFGGVQSQKHPSTCFNMPNSPSGKIDPDQCP
jgi:hypothetical protein